MALRLNRHNQIPFTVFIIIRCCLFGGSCPVVSAGWIFSQYWARGKCIWYMHPSDPPFEMLYRGTPSFIADAIQVAPELLSVASCLSVLLLCCLVVACAICFVTAENPYPTPNPPKISYLELCSIIQSSICCFMVCRSPLSSATAFGRFDALYWRLHVTMSYNLCYMS